MSDDATSLIKTVREGLERACKDFTVRIAPLGFKREKKMLWSREGEKGAEQVGFFRLGSSYGAPRTASVDIRVMFSLLSPSHRAGPMLSDPLRDSRGRAYHLRFNAKSWSTYERCIDDLVRVVTDHGLPWFAQQGSNTSLERMRDE